MQAISRRSALSAGAGALAAALPLPASAGIAADAALLALEQGVGDAYRRWAEAIAILGDAQAACYALQAEQPGSAATEAAEARVAALETAEGLLSDEVEALVDGLIAMPATTIAGLACKARVALLVKSDDHDAKILEELARFGGRARA